MGRITHRRARVKRVKPPKPIPPAKPERPKRSDLKNIYKGLLSLDIGQRVNTLAKAMHWFDKAQVYILYKQKGKWTRAQLTAKNKSEYNRTNCIHSTKLVTKENCLMEAINWNEKLVQS